MAWIGFVPTLLVSVAVVVLPGVLPALALRLRGLTFLAAIGTFGVALTAVTSLIGPMLSLDWSFALPMGAGIGLGLLLLLLKRWTGPAPERLAPSLLWPAIAVLVAGVIIAWNLRSGISSPEVLSQTYDNVFHFNAVAFILQNGDASPLHMTLSNRAAETAVYPTTWHALSAIIVQLTGVEIQVAMNGLLFVTAALLWPANAIFFAKQFLGAGKIALLCAAVLSTAFSAFPYLLMSWGVLYPNFLSTALIPAALGFLHALLRPGTAVPGLNAPARWLGSFAAIGAASFAHPNSLFAMTALALPLAVASAPALLRAAPTLLRRIVTFLTLVLPFVLVGIAWSRLTTGDNSRTFEGSIPRAFVSAVTNAPLINARAWMLTILVLVGAVLVLRAKQHRWLLFSYLAAVTLYTLSSGAPDALRTPITGLWYNDANRLAALLPIVALPLAAIALSRGMSFYERGAREARVGPQHAPLSPLVRTVAVALAFLVVVAGLRGTAIERSIERIRNTYNLDNGSALLTPNEIQLFEQLPEIVPEGSIIAGNPWNGSALAFAYSEREVLFPHLNGVYSDDAWTIANELQLGTPQACAAADRLNVQFVLDLGDLYTIGGGKNQLLYPGITDVRGSSVLTEVTRVGSARLLEVTGCEEVLERTAG